MDTCYYCGACYHPMPVYTLGNPVVGNPNRIWACSRKLIAADSEEAKLIGSDKILGEYDLKQGKHILI